jgi:hypothetical protein
MKKELVSFQCSECKEMEKMLVLRRVIKDAPTRENVGLDESQSDSRENPKTHKISLLKGV